MTDYIPTTEEVLDAYQGRLLKIGDTVYKFIDEKQAEAEFDRWLADVKAQERKAERERAVSIIMTNIGQIVWQATHNPEGQAIDTSKMLKEIMGETE